MQVTKLSKLSPNELSAKDQVKFYRQEVFEGKSSFKVYLFLLSLILLVIDKIGDAVVFPRITNLPGHFETESLVFIIVGTVAYAISLKAKKLLKPDWAFNFMLIFNTLAVCSLTVYITLENLVSLEKAMESKTALSWDIPLEDYATSLSLFMLSYFLMPTWHLKAVLPCGYSFAIIFTYFEKSHPMRYWVLTRLGLSCLVLIAIMFLHSRLRWRKFVKNLEVDGWNQVYQDIMSRIPSALGVVNLDGEIVYSNMELKKLMEKKNSDSKMLFRGIVQVKKRYCSIKNLSTIKDRSFKRQRESVSTYEFKLNIPQDEYLSPIHNEESYLTKLGQKTHEGGFEERVRRLTSEHNPKTFFEQACEFDNFSDVLQAFKASMDASKEPISEKHLVYDGKLFFNGPFESKTAIPISYEIRLCPLYEYQKVIVILNNTTERDLIASAEESSQYKDKLLASISHNLRTPLNGSLTFLQGAINDNKVDISVKEKLIAPAIRSGTLLLNLINDILDYSLLETREFSLCLELKPLQATLGNAYNILKDAIIAKGLTCKIEIDEKIPSKFNTDHHRLTQIVLNLLGNALKFTYKGEIKLKATYIDPTKVEIAIQDTGIGMRKSEVDALKNELLHPSMASSKSQKSKGIGLGLKISNDLAKKLNVFNEEEEGIVMESIKGKGSTFSFIIANYKSDEAQIGISSPFALESNFAQVTTEKNTIYSRINFSQPSEIDTLNEADKKYNRFTEIYCGSLFNLSSKGSHTKPSLAQRIFSPTRLKLASPRGGPLLSPRAQIPAREILVVDDDPMNILGVELLLNKLNITITKAYNGQQAIEKVQERASLVEEGKALNFRAILMDCQMPVMDGYQASKVLKELMENNEIMAIPIIGCTAFTAKNKLEECLACGMDAVITKPVSFKRLCEMFDN